MNETPDGLGEDARALLDSARSGLGPSPEERVRLRRTVLAGLAGGAGVGVAGTTSGAAASAAGLGFGAKVIGVAVVCCAVGAGGGVLVREALAPAPVDPPSRSVGPASRGVDAASRGVDRVAVGPVEVRPASGRLLAERPRATDTPQHTAAMRAAPIPALQPTVAITPTRRAPSSLRALAVPERAPLAARAAATEAVSAPRVAEAGLSEESALLAAAQRALRESRHGEARALLAEHARTFPAGPLADEAAALAALLACAARDPGAQVRAEAFVAHHAQDRALAARVASACELDFP